MDEPGPMTVEQLLAVVEVQLKRGQEPLTLFGEPFTVVELQAARDALTCALNASKTIAEMVT